MNCILDDILLNLDPNKFAKIIDESAFVCFINLKGELIYASDPFYDVLGLDKSTPVLNHLNALFPSEININTLDFWEKLNKNKKWRGALGYQLENNSYKSLSVRFSVVENAEHSPVFYLGQFSFNLKPLTYKQFSKLDSSYKWFFKRSPVPKALIDIKSLKYLEVNRSWENYLGIKGEDTLDQTYQKLNIHDLFDPDFISKIQSSAYGHVASTPLKIYKGSEVKESLISFEKIALYNKTYLLLIITDFSAQLKFQSELKDIRKNAVRKKRTILKLSELVGSDLRFIFEEIPRLCAEVLEIDRVSIWKFDEEVKHLSCVSAFGVDGGNYMTDYELSMSVMPEYFKLLLENKTLIINDALRNKLTKNIVEDYLQPMGITSSLDVVIPGNEKPYGIACFEHLDSKKEWNVEDEEFASSISNIISLAVEYQKRSHAEVELKKSNEKLSALNEELKKLKLNLEQENIYLREEIDLVFNYEEMVYGSKTFSQVLTDVEQVAATNATVLLLGESGTGKELLARAIHNISPRKNKPLIKVNCAAIPRELLESELFGHKKGSFTGAISDKLGKFQLADGGTLFLDEIGELPLEMQPKLLRAIQESEVEQIGSTTTQKVNIRIIAATNRDLQTEVREKRFREDLYFRINVFPIVIPPLRERVEDIPILIEHFVNKYTKLYNKKITFISQATKRNLQTYPWPGNVRELENLIERAVILSNDNVLMIPNFKSSPAEALISTTVLSLEDVQRIHIKKILKRCNWKIDGFGGASDLLQIKPSTLRDRMKKLGIEKPS